MAAGGQKRTRSQRVASLELPPGRLARTWAILQHRDVLLRIALVLAGAVLLCVVTTGWDPPLPYRLGYTPSSSITARVPFAQVDSRATEIARDQAQRRERHVYARHPELLAGPSASLVNAVAEVIRAETLADLTAGEWDQFQPPESEDRIDPGRQAAEVQFQRFREALAGDEKLTRFQKAVTAALAPWESRGLLEKLSQGPGEGNPEEIVVYPVGHPDQTLVVAVSDVLIGDGTAIHVSLHKHLQPEEVADAVFEWLQRHLTDTLVFDEDATDAAKAKAAAGVLDQFKRYEPGDVMAKAGIPLDADTMRTLRQEHRAVISGTPTAQRAFRMFARASAVIVMVLILFTFCGIYGFHRTSRFLVDSKQLALLLGLIAVTVGFSRWAAIEPIRAEIIPLLLFGMAVAIAFGRETSMLLSGVTALIMVAGLGTGLTGFLVLMGVTTVAILMLQRIRSRRKLIYVGLVCGAVAMMVTVVAGLLDNQPLAGPLLTDALRNALWALAAGFLMSGLLPFIESLFGVVTEISLLELGDVAHPLLQELVRRAPSTYNHSISVGAIAEAAAESIGARGLLVRVGAYFHDIGKMLNSGYFIENQGENGNRHETLKPTVSTLVIIAHVKDGVDLARRNHLPEPIIDFIEQHHGTWLLEFFYRRANEQKETDPDAGEVEEATYRYPGPKPQTKEAGVLMLADAVESASRSLVDPAPARLESIVRDIAEKRLRDGQFDESGLTLRELRTIQNSLAKTLAAIYHGRVKYPDQRTA